MTHMRGRLVAAVAVALLAAGCGGEGSEETKPAVKAEAEVSVQEVTPAARSAADVPTPTAAQKQAYLAALRRIDPGLTVNEERVMRRAERVCARVLQGSGGGSMSLTEYTRRELSGGNATITTAQAQQVIAAVKVWCRK